MTYGTATKKGRRTIICVRIARLPLFIVPCLSAIQQEYPLSISRNTVLFFCVSPDNIFLFSHSRKEWA